MFNAESSMAKCWILSVGDIIRPCGDPTHRDASECAVKEGIII